MKSADQTFRYDLKLAKTKWGKLPSESVKWLREMGTRYSFSLVLGDLLYLDGRWYVTHSGLLRVAQRNRCSGIRTAIDKGLSDPSSCRWVFKATVYKSPRSRGFVGYGDADPSNVSSLVHGAEMRVAETRAVNRALRKAYGIGLCSVEELGWTPRTNDSSSSTYRAPAANGNHGHLNGQPRLRDRLCLLIRQYKLDANLVKAYAADYCGTATLREASRELVEGFINDLSLRASKDLPGLVCQLNSYAKPPEVGS